MADVFVVDGQAKKVIEGAAHIDTVDGQINLSIFCDDHAEDGLLGGHASTANRELLRKALMALGLAFGDSPDTGADFPSLLGRSTPTGLSSWGIDSEHALALIRSAAA